MANEFAQWGFIFIIILALLVSFLTTLDDKLDILRPRYVHKPPEPQPQPQQQRKKPNARKRYPRQ